MRQHQLKKYLAAGTVLAVMVFSSFRQTGKYTLTGQISNLKDGDTLELIPSGTHNEEKPVSRVVVKDGKFTFTGSVAEPRLFFVKLKKDTYGGFQVLVENTAINMTGTAVASKDGDSHQYDNVKITGSKSHDEFILKTASRARLNELYEAYNNNNKEISEKVYAARVKKDSVLYNTLIASEAYKKLEREEKAFFDTVSIVTNSLITANKDTWWGPFLMLNQFSYFTPEQKPLFEQFSESAKNSYYGKIVAEELFPASYIGKKAPSLTFINEKQQPVAFSKLAKGKKYVLIDFWASWCGPCRKAIPELKRFYEEMSDKGVEIISVSIDKKAADWEKANNFEKFPWHSFLDTKDMSKAYGVRAIPAMFLLDGNGKVVAENVTLEDVRAKLQ